MNQSKSKFPTETINLPSKGLLYPPTSPLASGKIELKYMTAREEDILTNQNYLKQGTVIDKLLQAMIITDVNYNELLSVDKDAIMVAARILGYGKEYQFDYMGETHTVDLSTLEDKPFNESNIVRKGLNEFNFTLPHSKTQITYKLLTHADEKAIDQELNGLKKINSKASYAISTRLKYMITSVDGDYEQSTIRDFVDNYMLAMDSQALRSHIQKNSPGLELKFTYTNMSGEEEVADIPVGIDFFGLTPEYRALLFNQIHDIVYNGNGGYDWHTIYDMPIWLRKLTFFRIKQTVEAQNNEQENIQKSISSMKNAQKQTSTVRVPDYVTKLPKN